MRHARMLLLAAALSALIVPSTGGVASAAVPSTAHDIHLLASGLQGSSGSTVGPDGALYVAEGVAGRISRVDPRTGSTTTVASGFSPRRRGVRGAVDNAILPPPA